MARFDNAAIADIDVNAAPQAGIEAANQSHDVYTLEVIFAILLKNGRALNRILVRTRHTVNIPRTGIPRRRGIWVVIRGSRSTKVSLSCQSS